MQLYKTKIELDKCLNSVKRVQGLWVQNVQRSRGSRVQRLGIVATQCFASWFNGLKFDVIAVLCCVVARRDCTMLMILYRRVKD